MNLVLHEKILYDKKGQKSDVLIPYSEYCKILKLLEDLDATGVFENDTIRIIEYDQSGDFIDVVEEFEFKENIDFINKENAVGTLIWNALGGPMEKFYCIYFDVIINLGNRDELPETPGMSPSGDAAIGYFSFVEGWYIDSLLPADGSYCLMEECVDILVTTTSKAENVSAYIFYNCCQLCFRPDCTNRPAHYPFEFDLKSCIIQRSIPFCKNRSQIDTGCSCYIRL